MMVNVNIPCIEHLGVEVHISLRQLADWSSNVDQSHLESQKTSEHPAGSLEFAPGLVSPHSWNISPCTQFQLIITPTTKTFKTIQKASAKHCQTIVSDQFSICFRSEFATGWDGFDPNFRTTLSVAGYSLCPEHPDFIVLPASSWEDLNKSKLAFFHVKQLDFLGDMVTGIMK